MNLNLLASATEQISLIIESITDTIISLLKSQNQVTIAVSGGKSPIALFKQLSQTNLPWNKIIITLVDERVTHTGSEDSNENLVRKYLLQNNAIGTKFLGLVSPKQNMQKMQDEANTWVKQIDIVILGMGDDGHTASLFPKCKEFTQVMDKNALPAYVETNPTSAKYTRIGLNLSALIQIKHIIISITGETKLKVIQEAIKGDNPNYPISYLLKQRPDTHIFLF